MTTNADASTSCDRCGADLGNGSLTECVVVTVLNTEQAVENLHLGLAQRCGCAAKVLTKATFTHYTDTVRNKGEVLALYVRQEDKADPQDSTVGTASVPQNGRTKQAPAKATKAPAKRVRKAKA